MTTDPPALALDRISKRFGGVAALTEVSFAVSAGHVHALLGENGAGKTTLMHVAFGMVTPDAGTIRVHGERIDVGTPSNAIAAGIGMVHQHFTLVPAMNVAENLALGGHGLLHQRTTHAVVRQIASATGFDLDPSALVEALSVGAQQRVEIAKALVRNARILILDEPTAVLAPAETEDLLRWLRRFADAGNAVVLITHKLHEALAIADRVTVLRHGRVVHSGAARDTSAGALTAAMVGEATDSAPLSAAPPPDADGEKPGEVEFHARDISVLDEEGRLRLRAGSFVVRRGEIVGIAGVEGAGQRELLRALAGRVPIHTGSLNRPKQVGFVPEDRHRDAVLLARSLVDNVALHQAGRRRGRMPWRSLVARTRELMHEFDVRAPGPGTPMRALSGGNQQKLVLAREMGGRTSNEHHTGAAHEQRALVVENPTRGLDVRATADVHSRLRTARRSGAAIVLYSSDLDELLSLSDRVLVVHAGVVREVSRDRAAIGRAMLGGD